MSVIASALKHMLAAGMPADAIVAAVAEMEANLQPSAPVETRSKGAIRTARWRHKASQSVTDETNGDDVTQNVTRPPSPTSPMKKSNPSTPTHGKTKPRAREGLPTLLPQGWKPEEFENGTKCREIIDGWTPEKLEIEVERFIARHASRAEVFTDWQAAWKTWVLNDGKFNQGSKNGSGNRGPAARRPSRADEMDLAYDNLMSGRGGMGSA